MACEIFISNPIPEQKYYQGLESPAGLSWLKSPAYTPCPEWGFQGEVKERVRFIVLQILNFIQPYVPKRNGVKAVAVCIPEVRTRTLLMKLRSKMQLQWLEETLILLHYS